MPKYPLIHVKYARKILKSTRRSSKHLAIQIFSRKEMITWHEMRLSAATLNYCQNLQKVGHDIVIFNGNVLGHA